MMVHISPSVNFGLLSTISSARMLTSLICLWDCPYKDLSFAYTDHAVMVMIPCGSEGNPVMFGHSEACGNASALSLEAIKKEERDWYVNGERLYTILKALNYTLGGVSLSFHEIW